MTSEPRSDNGGRDLPPTITASARTGSPAHVAPTISYLGTLADVTLGSGGPPTDAFGDVSGGIPGDGP